MSAAGSSATIRFVAQTGSSSAQVHFLIATTKKAELRKLADERGQSLSSYMRHITYEHLSSWKQAGGSVSTS